MVYKFSPVAQDYFNDIKDGENTCSRGIRIYHCRNDNDRNDEDESDDEKATKYTITSDI